MSENKKEKWNVLRPTPDLPYRILNEDGWQIAEVLKDVDDKEKADLIAAAPTMLEALEAAAEELYLLSGGQHGDNGAGDCLHDKILPAIKAAKG